MQVTSTSTASATATAAPMPMPTFAASESPLEAVALPLGIGVVTGVTPEACQSCAVLAGVKIYSKATLLPSGVRAKLNHDRALESLLLFADSDAFLGKVKRKGEVAFVETII